ncbi:TetR/AcrR family transcriptional regulator [Rhodococcus koreensis]
MDESVRTRPPTRKWASSPETRELVIQAALELFAEVGYERTTIEDIVKRSGVSVGSIYHHIGGKADVFFEVTRDVGVGHAAATREAQAAARSAGETDPVRLYLHGARAYLKAAWKSAEITRVVIGDDRPSGSASVQNAHLARMVEAAGEIIIGKPPTSSASAAVVVALLRTASQEMLHVENEVDADRISDYFLGLIHRLVVDGPLPLPSPLR